MSASVNMRVRRCTLQQLLLSSSCSAAWMDYCDRKRFDEVHHMAVCCFWELHSLITYATAQSDD